MKSPHIPSERAPPPALQGRTRSEGTGSRAHQEEHGSPQDARRRLRGLQVPANTIHPRRSPKLSPKNRRKNHRARKPSRQMRALERYLQPRQQAVQKAAEVRRATAFATTMFALFLNNY